MTARVAHFIFLVGVDQSAKRTPGMTFRDFFRGARLLQHLHAVSRSGVATRSLGALLGGTGLALGGWFSQGTDGRIILAEQAATPALQSQASTGVITTTTTSGTRKDKAAVPPLPASGEGKDRRDGDQKAKALTEETTKTTTTTTVTTTTMATAPVYSAAWDENWDKRGHTKPKAVRHLILIRHGQYFTEENDPAKQRLTQLGSEQAVATGYRLSTYPHKVTVIHHSTMTRAKETTNHIAKFLPGVPLQECPLLVEGGPVTPIPGPSASPERDERYFRDGPRIEAAFRKHFHRANPDQEEDSYEIIVGHANVIRYFVCRAMQLAPEGITV